MGSVSMTPTIQARKQSFRAMSVAPRRVRKEAHLALLPEMKRQL